MSVTGINVSGCCCCGVCVVVDVVVVGVVSETRRFSQFTVAFIDWTDGGWTKGAAHRESGIDGGKGEEDGCGMAVLRGSRSVHLQISHVTFKGG